jgi:hypothetical protein
MGISAVSYTSSAENGSNLQMAGFSIRAILQPERKSLASLKAPRQTSTQLFKLLEKPFRNGKL